jgi:hypothetical protein
MKKKRAPQKTGRKTDFRPEYIDLAQKLAAKGWTDLELADFFGVCRRTLMYWKSRHEDFAQALKVGKEIPDDRVVRSLYERAVGYTQPAVKIFMPAGAKKAVIVEHVEHIPPDTAACRYWLNNRRPDEWRDKVEHTGAGGGPMQLQLTEQEQNF